MLSFPQLNTGAAVQFPFTAEYRARTVVQEWLDGGIERAGDAAAQEVCWRLRYRGLSDAEVQALEALHNSARGRLRSFLFLDPAANLLAWSEALGNAVWIRSPLLSVAGITAEGNAAFRLVNAGQADQSLSQTLAAPAELVYSFSFEARSASTGRIAAEQSAASDLLRTEFAIGNAWTRCVQSGRLASAAEAVEFRVILPPGTVVEVRGLQVEAQPQASEYKPTYSASGIYPETRFSQDRLSVVTQGSNNHEVEVNLTSRVR